MAKRKPARGKSKAAARKVVKLTRKPATKARTKAAARPKSNGNGLPKPSTKPIAS